MSHFALTFSITFLQGIGVEMERLAAKMGGTVKWPYNDSECLDAEFFKVKKKQNWKSDWTRKCISNRYFFLFQIVADHLIKESGVRPILHCYAVEAIMDNDTIKGIITESKSGRQAILADRVIDCTGDADVAYLAGAEYRYVPCTDLLTNLFGHSVHRNSMEIWDKSPIFLFIEWRRKPKVWEWRKFLIALE